MNAELALSAIEATGIVPVVRAPSAALAERAVSALAAGGIDVFEITLTVPGALELIASLSQRLGGRGLVGAGSVLSADQARAALDAGAQFVVSPGLDLGVLETALARDALVAPGALTPTEVLAAERAGARLVKIFPCSALGGPKYVRALRGPMPNARLLPTGGVNAATAGEYLRAGAVALGVGSELIDLEALSQGKDELVTERARELLRAVAAARKTSDGARPAPGPTRAVE
ncbi:MAG TPA: bifunctional 4-hydroxy-2-oxoglutarate aldolase/2-dehydro-3-deoxy-phosphogluconate aldolase [Polyangiaceae bacterium]|nr:bifunctional 4-hydroxy-2-oxoglutarate aldolase/2-dehydro-3-deoxy-phosphogluconate aldolase [Polyangiaceae bacterium]